MRYGYDGPDWSRSILPFLAVAAIVTLVIYFCIKEHDARVACEDSGGTYESYNCQTVYVPMSCGRNCTMIVPIESCDHRCVGAAC